MSSQEVPAESLRQPKSDDVADFSIVLVAWNNLEYLEPCLKSLFQRDAQNSFDVLVVDNGSTDGSQEMLRTQFPQVRLLENNENVGLAKACNQGIGATRGRHVLLLNNDTLVDTRSLDTLVAFMDATPKAGAVGGKLLNPDGSFQSGFSRFSSLWQELLIATRLGDWMHDGYPSHGDDTKIRSVDWLSSACLLLRRSALDEVGCLDEEYFIYGDEADLQYRLKRAGWKVFYLPEATIVHFGGRSMDRWRRRKMVYRGKMLFYRKNYGTGYEMSLRALLATLTFFKLAIWSAAWLLPSKRETARRELASNLDVANLCWKLQ